MYVISPFPHLIATNAVGVRYFQLTNFFSSPSTTSANLTNQMQYLNSLCKDPTLLAPFSENHDRERFPSYTDDMAVSWTFLKLNLSGTQVTLTVDLQSSRKMLSHSLCSSTVFLSVSNAGFQSSTFLHTPQTLIICSNSLLRSRTAPERWCGSLRPRSDLAQRIRRNHTAVPTNRQTQPDSKTGYYKGLQLRELLGLDGLLGRPQPGHTQGIYRQPNCGCI